MNDRSTSERLASVVATTTAGEEATFQATGRTIEFPGYLRAYVEGADDPDAELEDREAILPPLEEGDAVSCRELRASGHSTQPPARYTEASLVKELEDRGIGRPSTYASVLDTIVNKRDYVWKKGNALVPCINQALAAMKSDGSLKSLTDKYFPGTTANIPVFR